MCKLFSHFSVQEIYGLHYSHGSGMTVTVPIILYAKLSKFASFSMIPLTLLCGAVYTNHLTSCVHLRILVTVWVMVYLNIWDPSCGLKLIMCYKFLFGFLVQFLMHCRFAFSYSTQARKPSRSVMGTPSGVFIGFHFPTPMTHGGKLCIRNNA